jgi:hypothetical protein
MQQEEAYLVRFTVDDPDRPLDRLAAAAGQVATPAEITRRAP